MRYFEIVKLSKTQMPVDADNPEEFAPEDTVESEMVSESLNQINRPSRQQHLSPRRSL